MNANEFINKIPSKVFEKIRNSKGDAECRRLLKELARYLEPFFCWDECVQNAQETGDPIRRCEIECDKCKNEEYLKIDELKIKEVKKRQKEAEIRKEKDLKMQKAALNLLPDYLKPMDL